MRVVQELSVFVQKAGIAGSIRRRKNEVNDIDIVILPKVEFRALNNIKKILRKYGKPEVEGNKIIRVRSKEGIKIDGYIADKKIMRFYY